jgi:hypothetical protein
MSDITIKVDGVDKLSYSYEEPAPTIEQSRTTKEGSEVGDDRSFLNVSASTGPRNDSSTFNLKKQIHVPEFDPKIVEVGDRIIAKHPRLIGSDDFELEVWKIPKEENLGGEKLSPVMYYIEYKHDEAVRAMKAAPKK